MRRRRVGVLVAGACAVVLAWLVAPTGVPLYDGIGFPDEPYRYVDPPSGYQKTKPPTIADAQSPVANGTSTLLMLAASRENGPQVAVSLPSRSLAAPQATRVTLTATPEAPDTQPSGARIDGNVYRVAWTADRGPVTTTSRISVAYVLLRATTGKQPGPKMYHRASPDSPWSSISTTRVGRDIYQSPLAGAGDYALAFSLNGGSGSGSGSILAIVAGVVGFLIVVLVVVRFRRRGAPA